MRGWVEGAVMSIGLSYLLWEHSWLEKATAQNPDAFYMFYQKARVLAKLGKKQEALAVSNKSVELSKAAKNDDYVALNMKLQNELK